MPDSVPDLHLCSRHTHGLASGLSRWRRQQEVVGRGVSEPQEHMTWTQRTPNSDAFVGAFDLAKSQNKVQVPMPCTWTFNVGDLMLA